MIEEQRPLTFAKKIVGRVSDTFGVSISLLPGNLGKAVLTGYLLCRIADTIEDDSLTPVNHRQELLGLFYDCFNENEKLNIFIEKSSIIKGDEACLELLRGSKLIFSLLHSLPKKSADIVSHWSKELSSGMRKFIVNYPEGIHIQTMEELHEYCYWAAGTVGHMLTELFYHHSYWINKRHYKKLEINCEKFGEGLQLTNILKDIAWDVEYEHEIFLPQELLLKFNTDQEKILSPDYRQQNYHVVKILIDLAKKDFQAAVDYFCDIPRMAISVRLFSIVPIVVALATLREVEHSREMLQSGGQIKISRQEVKSLLLACGLNIMSNKRIKRLISVVQEKAYIR